MERIGLKIKNILIIFSCSVCQPIKRFYASKASTIASFHLLWIQTPEANTAKHLTAVILRFCYTGMQGKALGLSISCKDSVWM
jgi:hypothetical protein